MDKVSYYYLEESELESSMLLSQELQHYLATAQSQVYNHLCYADILLWPHQYETKNAQSIRDSYCHSQCPFPYTETAKSITSISQSEKTFQRTSNTSLHNAGEETCPSRS